MRRKAKGAHPARLPPYLERHCVETTQARRFDDRMEVNHLENENRKSDNAGQNSIVESMKDNLKTIDSGTAPWMILGFCLPMIGLVLYLVWKDTREADSKAAGTGALLSVCISAAFYVLMMAGTMAHVFL